MTADADLPVWTIKPNWSNGVTERLDWLTDIQSSTLGVEQAIAYRLSPRRTFEALYNPVGSVRSYFDLWLHRMGGYEFMLPLWHDTGRLTAAVSSGATTLAFDTTYREFNVGDLAVLVGSKPHIFDKVEITAVTDSGITVAPGGVTRSWPKGSKINPLRRARFSDNSQFSALTNVVAQATIQFELNQANDIADEGTWSGLSYLDLPVQTTKPNWRETVDLTFVRNVALLDNDLGLRQLDDEAGRAFTLQMHSFMLIGREQHWAFRQMLYRLRGRQGALWVPTFNEDIRLATSRLTSDFTLDIDKIGYAYTGGVVKGRNHVLIGGATPAEITALGIVGDDDLERLVLGGPLGTALDAGTIGSFMDTCHLASDSISITHHTDTDGVAECKLGFQSFLNERTDDDPIYYPLAAATERDVPCGEPTPPPPPPPRDPCLDVTAINVGQLTVEIASPTPAFTWVDEEGPGNPYFQVNLVYALKDYFGNFYIIPYVTLFNEHADGSDASTPIVVPHLIEDTCGNRATVYAGAVRTGPGSCRITVEVDSAYFRFADASQPQPSDVDFDQYVRDGSVYYGMIEVCVGGDTEAPGELSTVVTVGDVSGAPSRKVTAVTDIGSIGGKQYRYTSFAAFPMGLPG